ncbi:hypothetical protein RugamoR57_37630 [Duganella caerulea]|uniref:phage tail protein n=1 Tax=Duganella caerulea TaxID=2885762 RepID=UPI0030E7E8DC
MFNFFIALIINLVIAAITPVPKSPRARQYQLSEFQFPTATEDRAQPLGFGTFQVAANVLSVFDYDAREVTKSVKAGLFKTTKVSLGYRYYVGMWLSLSAATCDSVREVRLGDHLVWAGDQPLSRTAVTNLDVNSTWTASEGQEISDGLVGRFAFYNHAVDVADSAISSPYVPLDTAYLAGEIGQPVPAYPNTLHAVFLGPSAASVGLIGKPISTPQYGFVGSSPNISPLLLTLKRLPVLTAALGGGSRDFRVISYPFAGSVSHGDYTRADLDGWLAARADVSGDANPAFAILELLTTRLPGVGPRLSTYAIALETFFRAADVLHSEGNGVSFAWESSRSVGEVIGDLLKQLNGQLEINERTGQLQLTLIRETDAPVMTFDDSNIIELTSFSRISVEEAPNVIQVPFVDRQLDWQSRVASTSNPTGLRSAGAEIARSNEYIGVSRADLAGLLASRDIRVVSSPLASATWTATVPTGTVLKPGNLIILHPPGSDLTVRMRIASSRFANWSSRLRVELEAIEDVFRNGVSSGTTTPTLPPSTPIAPPESLTAATLAPAPYALTGDDYDQLLYLGTDPSTSTSSFQLAVQEGLTAWSDYDTATYDADRHEPAISAFLVAALAASTQSPTLQFSLTDAAVEQWSRATRGQVYIVAGSEWMVAGTWSLSGNTLTATAVERGIFDTVPGRFAAGTSVKLVLGYAIYPARLRTYVAAGYELPGLTSAVGRADSYGAGGRLEAVNAVGSQASWTYVSTPGGARAPKPLPPGAVKIGSSWGALSVADVVPAVTRAATVTLNWVNRNRLARATAGYYTALSDNEPGVTLSYALDWETSPGVFTNFGTYTTGSAGATTGVVNLGSVPAGARMIRIRVQTNRPAGGSFAQSAIVEMFWQLTS